MATALKVYTSKLLNFFRNHQFVTLLCLFTVNVVFWGSISDYNKVLAVYPDELRYFDIARSLASGDGIQINNVNTEFQKILYSLIIFPAFFFKSSFVQIRAVAWINSIVISTALFPTFLLAKDILKSRKWAWIITLFTVTMPVFVNTNFFMSENIFFPLSIWTMYVFWKIFSVEDKKKRLIYSLVGGILCYLAYLNKEIALYFILAYLAVELFSGVINKDLRKKLPCIAVLLSVFIFLFLLIKFTLFAGAGNSYNQTSINVLFQAGRIKYLLFSLISETAFILLSFFFFPVVITAVIHKDIKSDKFKFAIFSVLCVLIGCVAIAYTITIREDFPSLSPRIHTRYLEPLTVPLLIMAVNALHSSDDENKPSLGYKVLFVFSLAFSLGFLLFTEGISTLGCHVDTLSLKYVQLLLTVFSGNALFGPHTVRILAVVAILSMLYLLKRSKKRFLTVLISLSVVLNFANVIYAQFTAFHSYKVPIEYEIIENANEKLENLDGTLLIITHNYWDYNVIDAFFTCESYKTIIPVLQSYTDLSDNIIDLSKEKIHAAVPSEIHPYTELTNVDYILWFNAIQENDKLLLSEGSVTKVDDFSFPGFTLYKNNDSGKILFEQYNTEQTGDG